MFSKEGFLMNKIVGLGLFFLLVFAAGAFAQTVSEKTDVSVFDLSYYSYKVPDSALGDIDASIRSVYVNMGRFKVIQVAKSFDKPSDLKSLIAQIKKIKEKKAEIPEEVSYGRMTFSEQDFENLISSFVVIIPELTMYTAKETYDKKGNFTGYEVSMKTSISVLDVSTMEIIAQPIIESSGTNKDSEEQALSSAIDTLKSSLTFEMKKVPKFTIKTGVVEAKGGKITLQRGRNMGILPGFEFELISTEVLSNGMQKDVSDGLIIVSDVYEEVSDAVVIYGQPKEGDQLKEVPRAGGELDIPYYHMIYNPTTGAMTHVVGLKATVTLGMFSLRPFIGVEVPFYDYGVGSLILLIGIPANIYIGGEYTMYLGRLSISPTIALGVGGLYLTSDTIPSDQKFFFTHFGGNLYFNISYLITRDIKLTLDIGGAYWMSVYKGVFNAPDYWGILGGLGVTFKA
jgi:hypothetical protein